MINVVKHGALWFCSYELHFHEKKYSTIITVCHPVVHHVARSGASIAGYKT